MKKSIFIFVLSFLGIFLTTTVAYAAVTWSETQPGGNADFSWTPSAMSSNGQKIIVGNQAGTLYISSNKGSSWELIDPTGGVENPQWLTTSMSSNGQIILAGVYNGRLYRSTDGGSNWSEIQPAGNFDHDWGATSMSSDGQIMVAGTRNSGRLYKSTNGGTNWSEIQPAGNFDHDWGTTSMSSDGQIMLAGAINGRLYLSTNAGSNWIETQPAGDGDEQWYSVSMSSNGQVILAGNANSLFLSTNTGSSWTEIFPAGEFDKNWPISSVSSDGETLFAGGSERLYISTNRGGNWVETQPAGNVNRDWTLGNMSSDTQVLLAGVYNGRLYLGSNPLPTSTPSSGGGSSSPTSGPFSCTDSVPVGTPDLFQITTTKNTATLYFAPLGNSNGYYIGYGTGQDTGAYGVQTSFGDTSGVLSYTINLLSSNTTYSVIIRGQNGCMPGNWGNTMTIKTTNGGTMIFYKNFVSQVLSVFPQQTIVLGAKTKNTAKKKVVSKPVKKKPAILKKK